MKGYGRPRLADQDVVNIQESFLRSPQKSLRTDERELTIPKLSIRRALKKVLNMRAYKIQALQYFL